MKQSSSLDPSLSALRTFAAVVRHGSFRGAATERGVDPSAISHVIRGLEELLRVRLFHRTSRAVRLTEPGRLLFDRLHPLIDQLSDALGGIRAAATGPSGPLRLNVPRIANDLIVAPMLGRFLERYPDVSVEIVTDDGLVDIVANGFDAGIRRDRRLMPGMVSVPLGPARRFAVVGTPGYFATRDRPREPADLHGHRCIGRGFPNGARYGWEFRQDGTVLELDVSGPLVVDDTALMIRAARDGVGLAFLFEELVAEDLRSGTLVRVLDEWCPPFARFHLYYSGRHLVPAPLRAFIDMLTGDSERRDARPAGAR